MISEIGINIARRSIIPPVEACGRRTPSGWVWRIAGEIAWLGAILPKPNVDMIACPLHRVHATAIGVEAISVRSGPSSGFSAAYALGTVLGCHCAARTGVLSYRIFVIRVDTLNDVNLSMSGPTKPGSALSRCVRKY